tara:strand:+ start:35720 stop:36676 length:957 start_codon:yes stop_codon:yes gene_type:complete
MFQTPVRIGWNVAAAAVLSLAFTGCSRGVESAGYEVILDQPETLSSNSSETTEASLTEARPAEAADAASDTISPATASAEESVDPEDSVEQPLKTELANNIGKPDPLTASPVDSAGEARRTEATTKDAKAVDVSSADQPGTDSKPATGTTSATAEATGSAAPKQNNDKTESKQPRIVTLLIPDKKFQTEGPEKALRVSFDDFDLLKVLNMDPVTEDAPSRMPKWLKDLDGKRIRVRGFMFPPFEDENIRAFTLARDNQICCFGRNPLVYDLVDVFMRKGESTDYIQNRPFDVIGVFHIGDSIIPGELYSLDDAVVIDQ